MKIQNLQNELSKRKLQMGEYFRITFDVLKVFAKENKLFEKKGVVINAETTKILESSEE